MIRLIINIIVLLALFSVSSFGYVSVTKVKYEGGISLFGKVAEADITLKQNIVKNTYKMQVKASITGMVKALSANRKDTFTSEGKIVDGIYVPHKFTKLITKTDYIKKVIYTFEYDKNRVLKETSIDEIVTENNYDIINLKKFTTKKLVKSTNEEYIKLQSNDYISMFLNLGVDKLGNGKVRYIDKKETDDILLISKSLFEVSKHNGEEVYRINFSKNDSLFFDKAVAVDIAFYGDAYLKKVSEKRTIIN